MSRQIFNSFDMSVLGSVFDEFCMKHGLNEAERENVATRLLAQYDPENVRPEDLVASLEAEYSNSKHSGY